MAVKEPATLRLGFVGCDTSHVVQFSRRINKRGIDAEQWVDGASIVLACPLPSAVIEQAQIDRYMTTLSDEGVAVVQRPEELLGRVDGVLVESNDGGLHREQALPFLEAGLPVFVDKPFATSVADAQAMLDAARRKGVPIMSASSLRYAQEVRQFQAQAATNGATLGAQTYSPASLHPRNPGLFHYGVHGVEMLYALMGTGCASVRCMFQEGAEVVVGTWTDGRLGLVRGTRQGTGAYGFTAFCEKGVVATPVDARFIYRELVQQIVGMFTTKTMPIPADELLEVVAFQEAALQSKEAGGDEVHL